MVLDLEKFREESNFRPISHECSPARAHCLMHMEAKTMEWAFERKTLIQGGVARRQEVRLSNLSLNPDFGVKLKGLGELQTWKLIG